MKLDPIKDIQASCDCSEKEAEQIYQSEVDNLRDLLYEDDLRFGDLEDACMNMGIDFDNIEELINSLGY